MKRFDGTKIAEARRVKGWRQADVAFATLIPEQNIGRYERGTSEPGLEAIAKIALALGCDIDFFFVEEGVAA